ncbi:MAG: helix-turn-helix domain-containing protein [bacterium]|nr:helix-turn-helix domain-containing protein [bacterium]
MKNQEYMTCKEAAEQWGVSVRNVQRLLKEDRIPGAKMYGHSWMIPCGTGKPEDIRNEKKRKEVTYALYGILATSIPMPRKHADAVLETFEEEAFRRQYAAELSYFRGDFEAVKQYYRSIRIYDRMYLCAAHITLAAAMSTGDYELYEAIMHTAELILEYAREQDEKTDTGVQENANGNPQTSRFTPKGKCNWKICNPYTEIKLAIDMLHALAAVSMLVPQMLPKWLDTNNFSEYPSEARGMLLYLRIKYLQTTNRFDEMLTTAQTVLTMRTNDDCFTSMELYSLLLCACANYRLENHPQTAQDLEHAIHIGMPNHLLTPFAELSMAVGGQLMPMIRKEYPSQYTKLVQQMEQTWINWLSFHNQFAQANITLVLSPEEYQLALLIKERKSYPEIAKLMATPEKEIHKMMTSIYQKLCIRGKARLRKFI